jgi:hypothetical protein
MTTMVTEAERQACADATEATGGENDCLSHCNCEFLERYEIPTLEDLERQLEELHELAEEWRRGWPELLQTYLDNCDNDAEVERMANACGQQLWSFVANELKGKMPGWSKVLEQAVNPTKKQICFENPIRYWWCSFVDNMTTRIEAGGCVVETVYAEISGGKQFCEDAAQKAHSNTKVHLERRIAEVSKLRDTWKERIENYVEKHQCQCASTEQFQDAADSQGEAMM